LHTTEGAAGPRSAGRVLALKALARPVDHLVMPFLRPLRREPRPSPQRHAKLTTRPSLGTSRRSRPHRALAQAAVIAALLPLAVAGCGATSQPSSQPAKAPATTATTTAASRAAVTGGRLVSAGALRATLSGENHTPRVNRSWRYAVTVTNATGRPLSGTVAIEFLFGGQIVAHDKPPTHPIANGLWQSTLKLPVAALGYPLTVRAIAHTPAGSITVDWPITTKR
jgi:hypothetical protein